MKKGVFTSFLLVAFIGLLMYSVSAANSAEKNANVKESKMATLHKINIKAYHPKSYHVKIGDLIQCYIDFPLSPDSKVSDIAVSVQNSNLEIIGVMDTSNPEKPDAGQVSAFFYVAGKIAKKPTLCYIRLTPFIVDRTAKQYNIAFMIIGS